MTPEQIREIVKMTIDELSISGLLKDDYQRILSTMEKRLYHFFNDMEDSSLTLALRRLSDDPYIDIIYLQYRDSKTLEWIAEYYEKDTRTIMRNKKRLIMALYETVRDA